MKKIENLLLKACGYTILILVLFYLFAVISDFIEAAIAFPTFALIFGFGVLISLAGIIFEINSLKLIWKTLMHYAVLLIAFCVIFVISGKISSAGPSAIFSAIIIFTFLYAIVFAIAYVAQRAIAKADARVARNVSGNGKEKKEKREYKPLYKD